MEWYWILLILSAALVITANIMMAAFMSEGGEIKEVLNPLNIYQENKVNIFGCVVLTILGNLIFAPYAICYWFYKACTVGRK